MPFTIFHIGPGLGIGLPLRRYLHAPTFIMANVLLDIEPLLVLTLDLPYPLHGYLHTFLLAVIFGFFLGSIMYSLENVFRPLYKIFLLEAGNPMKLRSFTMAGALGAILHVLLDSPLYDDIRPFLPLQLNLLYNPSLAAEVYGLCVYTGTFGIVYYLWLVGSALRGKFAGRA